MPNRTKMTLSLDEGHYAILQDRLRDMATQDAIMEDAESNGDEIAYDAAHENWTIAANRVASIVSISLTGEMKRALDRHEKRIESERET